MSYSANYAPTREQMRAWYAVKAAIRRGVLVRPHACQECGNEPGYNKRGRALIEGHHYMGYAKQHVLDVLWLCPPCHKKYDSIKGVVCDHYG